MVRTDRFPDILLELSRSFQHIAVVPSLFPRRVLGR